MFELMDVNGSRSIVVKSMESILCPKTSVLCVPSDTGSWNTARDVCNSFGNNRGKPAFLNDRGSTNRGRYRRGLTKDFSFTICFF